MGYRVSSGVGLCSFLLVVGLSVSCAQDQESLIVTSAHSITGECEADTGVQLPRVAVDASFGTGAIVFFALQNNLAPRGGDSNNTNVEDSEVKVTDVDVRLRTPQDGGIADGLDSGLTEYNLELATVSLLPGETTYVPIQLPNELIAQVASGGPGGNSSVTVMMDLEFHALRANNKFGGAGEIDARPFSFPVDVCVDCLRDCSMCPDDQSCAVDTSFPADTCGYAQGQPIVPLSCMMGG